MTPGKSLLRFGILTLALLMFLNAGSSIMPSHAVEPEEVLEDPVLEAEAREISKLLRCLVCQNQSIDESNAGLARDLRRLVRDRLVAGDTREEALDYIVSRYGDYVLLKPPVKRRTLLLWWAPVIFGAVAILAFIMIFKRGREHSAADKPEGPGTLTPEERRRLKQLLKKQEDQE